MASQKGGTAESTVPPAQGFPDLRSRVSHFAEQTVHSECLLRPVELGKSSESARKTETEITAVRIAQGLSLCGVRLQ